MHLLNVLEKVFLRHYSQFSLAVTHLCFLFYLCSGGKVFPKLDGPDPVWMLESWTHRSHILHGTPSIDGSCWCPKMQ